MRLYLIRHGETEPHWTGDAATFRDDGLTERGRAQVDGLARWINVEVRDVHAIYSSTLRRARETASPLSEVCGVSVRWDDRLREIGGSRLDHTPMPTCDEPMAYEAFRSGERPFEPILRNVPESETGMHFRLRVGSFIETLVQNRTDGAVLVVCHGGVIDAIFDHVFNVGPFRRCETWSDCTGVSLFEYVAHPRREAWRFHFHNRLTHLSMKD